MWIRSQDKEMLLNCEGFDILDEDTIWIIYGCDTTLATYSTKEKALKVLDMIEKYINSGGTLFVIDQQKASFGYTATYEKKLGVFQMPLDGDLEDET